MAITPLTLRSKWSTNLSTVCRVMVNMMSLFFFVSELMDLLLTGEDQSQADQPNNLAEGHPMQSNLI